MSLKKIIREEKETNKTAKVVDGGVFIPIKVGDMVLTGRFKNKKMVVKDISINKHGGLMINGRNVLRFRLKKQVGKPST